MPPTIYEHTPGVWINEVRLSPPPIAGVSTSIAAFIGQAPITTRYPNIARAVTSYDQFLVDYVLDLTTPANNAKRSTSLSRSVKGFFQNGGQRCWIVQPRQIVSACSTSDCIWPNDFLERSYRQKLDPKYKTTTICKCLPRGSQGGCSVAPNTFRPRPVRCSDSILV